MTDLDRNGSSIRDIEHAPKIKALKTIFVGSTLEVIAVLVDLSGWFNDFKHFLGHTDSASFRGVQ